MSKQDLNEALQEMKSRRSAYDFYDNYYRGNHRLAFATTKFREAFGLLFSAFSDNLCKSVVKATLDRLEINGWAADGAPKEVNTDDLKAAALKIWKTSGGARLSKKVHRAALVKADSYVMVWPDMEGFPRIYFQRPEAVAVEYDEENPGVMLWAAKSWEAEGGFQRVNLYYPDRIEKWISRTNKGGSSASAFVVFVGDGDDGEIPNPYGRVPMFHFAPEGGDGDGGVSELADAIPVQDAVNKSVCDLLVAMEFAAFPQRYAIGLEVEVDAATGQPKAPPFQAGAGRVWSMGNTEGEFGSFATADVEKLSKVADDFRLEMARVTGTPLSYMALTGTSNISGDALKALDSRMVKKAKDRQEEFGAVWADVMNFALYVAGGDAAAKLAVVPIWEAAEHSSQSDRAAVALQEKELGIPLEVVFERYGATEAEAKDWSDKAAQAKASALEGLAATFNAGGGAGL